jgi:hypothetical protein
VLDTFGGDLASAWLHPTDAGQRQDWPVPAPSDHKTYADRLTVACLGIKDPFTPESARPQQVIELRIPGPLRLDLDEIREEVERLAPGVVSGPQQSISRSPCILDEHLHHHSWAQIRRLLSLSFGS